jgi:hypothetical protein
MYPVIEVCSRFSSEITTTRLERVLWPYSVGSRTLEPSQLKMLDLIIPLLGLLKPE